QTHCASCHGAGGSGDGPVGLKYVPPPMDLTTDYVQQQADGQLFYTITHGGVVMPFYRDAIDIEDRWHLINYIKSELKTQ
ncbi:MAG: cytochrome c, partial [Gammaproteobacteria bacterium]|nr:cytochrome c [Gammaproteobacteria bacterium]